MNKQINIESPRYHHHSICRIPQSLPLVFGVIVQPSLLIHGNRRLYTMQDNKEGLGLIENASVVVKSDNVVWIGSAHDAPDIDNVIDGTGLIGLPGLIDPHTHAVWNGSRSNEFARRLAGENYADILEAGGGILSTVRATRAAPLETLLTFARKRIDHMRNRGVTCVEIKSGYGLNPETELRMLKAAATHEHTLRTVRTFLGAHTVPEEYRGRRDAYVSQIIEEQLPLCAPQANFVDVYCDRGAFDLDESIAILEAGKAHGLHVRAHAEQVSHTGIAAAAAKLGAAALDHLERVDEEGIAAMADAGTVAVLLPGAQLYLKDQAPPVAAFREAGVPMAIGTDLNPGSSPVHDIWTAATLACIIQGLTMEEAILGITRHAAQALREPRSGQVQIGFHADMALFEPPPGEPATVESLLQHMGTPHAKVVIQGGIRVL
jgi:imidazolonepropionase